MRIDEWAMASFSRDSFAYFTHDSHRGDDMVTLGEVIAWIMIAILAAGLIILAGWVVEQYERRHYERTKPKEERDGRS
jgi:hypothetical protein